MRAILKSISGILISVGLVATLLAIPTSAQDGGTWINNRYGGVENKNDNPQLHEDGPNSFWGSQNPTGTHGQDHHGTYNYTYGSNDSSRTNWATWNFTGLGEDRTYDVWVWVPGADATAQVRYNVHMGGCTSKLGTYPALNQLSHSGWVKIGRIGIGRIPNNPSRNITIEVNDNEIANPGDQLALRSIGIDAIVLVRDSGIGWDAVNSDTLITDEDCYINSGGDYSVINDGPSTSGGPWYPGTSGRGYGSNNYSYAYVRGTQNASGEVMSNSSFARWDFAGVPNGNCSVYVYIPSARATAGVYYHIYHGALGNYFGSVFLQQEDHEGWVRLVESRFESAVRLYVLNYEAMGVAPNSDSRGFQYNRIAADASRIVCGSGPAPTATPAPTSTNGGGPIYPYMSSANPTGSNEYGCRRYHLGSIGAGGDVDRWGLFGGECTSYVAFRLNEAGITFHNNFYTNGRGNIGCPAPQNANAQEVRKYRLGHPWKCRWGNAENWDDRAREVSIVVSSIPQIGSVAQWNSNWNGAGPDGHLAYVERVNADGSIVISDMNWVSPGCTVRENMTLTSGSGNWPSNFIYFHQAHNGQTGAAQLFN